MLLDTSKADAMQSALDQVFNRLPPHFQTAPMRLEMAKAVVHAQTHKPQAYRKAAQAAVLSMFDSPEKAVRNRLKLAPFAAAKPQQGSRTMSIR